MKCDKCGGRTVQFFKGEHYCRKCERVSVDKKKRKN